MLFALSGILLVATLIDLRSHRIPNRLTFGAALAGITGQLYLDGSDGLWFALGGLAVGFSCFLPSYLFGALGAGDVKLMAAVGCFLGPLATVVAAISTVIVGGALALTRIAWHGGLPAMGTRYGAMLWNLISARRLVYYGPQPGEAAAERFPYAMAIAMGTLMSLLWTQ